MSINFGTPCFTPGQYSDDVPVRTEWGYIDIDDTSQYDDERMSIDDEMRALFGVD